MIAKCLSDSVCLRFINCRFKLFQLIDDGQDSLKVVITNVAAEDEGQYCVEVSNGAGTVTTSAFCHIQGLKVHLELY